MTQEERAAVEQERRTEKEAGQTQEESFRQDNTRGKEAT